MSDSSRRVLVIGLDGATWDLLDGWASQGLLPTIERLRRAGAWGPLRSTVPPITPSCWTSMYTGTNPGKHGIFGFSQRGPGAYRLSPVHASARKAKTVFRVVSDAGLKVGVLNAPATYPPEPLNGFLVPGIPTPEDSGPFTSPPELTSELERLTQGRFKYPPGLNQATPDVASFLDACRTYADAVTEASTYMMDRLDDWSLFFVQFQVTDSVQHHFWHCLDTDHPQHDARVSDEMRSVIPDLYRKVDSCLERIAAKAGDGADILVASDHGGGPFHEQIYLNIWLWQNGWLKFKRTPTTLLRRLVYALGLTPLFMRNVVYSRVPRRARRAVESRKESFFGLAQRLFLSLDDVDWPRTRAYSYGGPFGAIYVNLKGREPHGSVPPDQYAATLTQLENDLRQMRHPDTREHVTEELLRSDQVYHGPFADQGPDLQVVFRGYRYNVGFLQFQSKDWIGPPWNRWTGHHSMNGMHIVSGPSARAGTKLDANIVDITPTVLALLGQPIPDWMDGEPLTDALSEGYQAPEVVHEEAAVSSGQTASGYSAEDEAEIAKRLADLGYIE